MSVDQEHLHRVRRMLWALLCFGTAASLAGNVTHAVSRHAGAAAVGPILAATLAPVALLGLTHLVGMWSRISSRDLTYWIFLGAIISLGAAAFRLSFSALRDLAESYGYGRFDASLFPLILDGLIAVCTLGLVTLTHTVKRADEEHSVTHPGAVRDAAGGAPVNQTVTHEPVRRDAPVTHSVTRDAANRDAPAPRDAPRSVTHRDAPSVQRSTRDAAPIVLHRESSVKADAPGDAPLLDASRSRARDASANGDAPASATAPESAAEDGASLDSESPTTPEGGPVTFDASGTAAVTQPGPGDDAASQSGTVQDPATRPVADRDAPPVTGDAQRSFGDDAQRLNAAESVTQSPASDPLPDADTVPVTQPAPAAQAASQQSEPPSRPAPAPSRAGLDEYSEIARRLIDAGRTTADHGTVRQVLRLAGNGKSNRSIAETVGVSASTVGRITKAASEDTEQMID